MITCPECAKEIADDSAHCGYCGAEIRPESGKKTMFGLGAISDEDMANAAEEARQKGAEARAQTTDDTSGPAKLKLPSSGLPKAGLPKSGLPKPGLPKPGLPEMGDAFSSEASAPSDAPRPIAIPKLGASISEAAEDAHDADEEMLATQMLPSLDERISDQDRRDEISEAQPGNSPYGATAGFDALAAEQPPESAADDAHAPEPLPTSRGEAGPAMVDEKIGEDAAWPAPEADLGPVAMPQGAPGGPMMASLPKEGMDVAGAEHLPVEPSGGEKNRKLVYVAIAIGGLVMFCCVGGIIWQIVSTFL